MVCVCACVTGAQSHVLVEGVLGRSELGKAMGDCFMCLRLSGSDKKYTPNILLFLLGNATPAVNKCFGKGPHDQRDLHDQRDPQPWAGPEDQDSSGGGIDFSQGSGSVYRLKGCIYTKSELSRLQRLESEVEQRYGI